MGFSVGHWYNFHICEEQESGDKSEEGRGTNVHVRKQGDGKIDHVAQTLGMEHECWVDEKSMANEVAFEKETDQHRTMCNNTIKDTFLMHTDDGIVLLRKGKKKRTTR